VHRALAEVHRARIVDELERAADGLDVAELAQRLHLHPNTVRWHLGVLDRAGVVSSHPQPTGKPGRPRVLHSLREEAGAQARESYRMLAAILAKTLSELPDGSDRAAQAGYAWGRTLAGRPTHAGRPAEADSTRSIVALLAREGFRPQEDARQIKMHRCPFGELSETSDGIACAVHRGLIAGALAELRSTLEVEQLDPFVEPRLCVARLGRRPTPGSRSRPR